MAAAPNSYLIDVARSRLPIDIGVVRLCERLLRHDPPTNEEVQQAREWVTRETKTAVAEMAGFETATFVGTAGTVTSLAAMAQKLPAYEPARIHNYVLKLETTEILNTRCSVEPRLSVSVCRAWRKIVKKSSPPGRSLFGRSWRRWAARVCLSVIWDCGKGC